jgi:hypothetical protein
MHGNDNPAFAELPSLFTYQALENSKIVVAALASISSTHKTAAPRFVGPSSQRASKGEPIHETRDHTPEFARVFLKAQFGRSPLHPGDATMLIFMFVVGFVAAILINFFG